MKKINHIQNATILTDDFRFHAGELLLEGDSVLAIRLTDAPQAEKDQAGSFDEILRSGSEVITIDAEGKKLIPGLIDVHMHGYYGIECDDPSMEKHKIIGEHLAQEGVTGYAATIGTAKNDKALKGIDANVQLVEEGEQKGARILGLHMEGPFLNPEKKGAMTEKLLQKPNLELLQEFIDRSHHLVKIMTVAPELEGAKELIEVATAENITISMGHTNATAEEAKQGKAWGATRVTHVFNAMRPLNHREPGVLGEALMDPDIQCELIGDLVHVTPIICQMVYKLKGADKITLISDALALAGLAKNQIPWYVGVRIEDAAYLPNGTLCGSISTVMTGVRNLVSLGVPLEDAVKMASINPARDLKLEEERGSITVGKKADLVLLNDDLSVEHVWIEGEQFK